MHSVICDVVHGLLQASTLRLRMTTCKNIMLTAGVTFIIMPLTNKSPWCRNLSFIVSDVSAYFWE